MQTLTQTITPYMNDDCGAFYAIKPIHSHLFKTLEMEDVWMEYKTNPSMLMRERAREELLFRQNKIICKYARFVWRAHKKIADYDDFVGYARDAAIYAYDHFKPELHFKLNTYVGSTIHAILMGVTNDIGFVRCYSSRRGFKSYFRNKYKGDKKKEFEDKHPVLKDKEKKEQLRQSFLLIDSEMVSYDEYTTSPEGKTIEQHFVPVYGCSETKSIIEGLDWTDAINSLSEVQKTVYQLFFVERFTVKEIMKDANISANVIKKEIKNIKLHFRKIFPELVGE